MAHKLPDRFPEVSTLVDVARPSGAKTRIERRLCHGWLLGVKIGNKFLKLFFLLFYYFSNFFIFLFTEKL